jgi:hypothetical protein
MSEGPHVISMIEISFVPLEFAIQQLHLQSVEYVLAGELASKKCLKFLLPRQVSTLSLLWQH